jgi:glycosyltransferase involved in cell wall biosynthesis
MHDRPTPYLVVLTSSNQLYSGTGTALFEWIRYAKTRFAFAICIDNLFPLNYCLARDFCQEEGIAFLPSGPSPRNGAADPGVADAPFHVASGRWPIIEIVSWANTATNLDVVAARRRREALVYTPHTQPSWTLPGAERFSLLESGFERALIGSDLVCCDSPAEVDVMRQYVPGPRALYVPIGINTDWFRRTETPRCKQILMVADFNEPRKRTELGVAAMVRLMERDAEFSAVVAGRGSDRATVPEGLTQRFKRLGFVSAKQLLDLYQRSSAFLLLSDYEAFGIPIVEALACGTPVVTTATREARSLFADMPGCRLVANTDAVAVDRAIDAAIADRAHGDISEVARARFNRAVTFRSKVLAIEALMPQ